MTQDNADRPVTHRFWRAPDRGRLDGAIRDATVSLQRCGPEARAEEWWLTADQYLRLAREYFDAGDRQQAWASLQAGQRAMLLNPGFPEGLELAAIQLRRETDKLSGWRAKAVMDLICDDKGELRKDIFAGSSRMRVISALALRDDQFQTNYFKILLRRRHLFTLFALLLAGIAASLILSGLNILPDPFNNIELMAGVVLFGALGAALSVARGLLGSDLSAKIPAQQLGSVVAWMRPAIGAAAALISFVFLNAKAIRLLDWDPASPNIIFAVAIVSGFSERFIVGAIERITEGKAGGDNNPRDEGGKDDPRKMGGE